MAIRRSPTQELDQLKDAAVKARLPFEREAWLNLAFYLDQQYVRWNKDNNYIEVIPKERDDDPRPVVNKIMHFVQQERSMVLQAKPTPDVLPASDDLISISDTSVCNAYVKYVAEPTQANFNRRLARATLWATIAGCAWLKWTWDPVLKRPSIVPCSIFEIACDPYVTDFEDARYIIHTKFMSVAEYKEKFPQAKNAKAQTADTMRSDLLRGMGSAPVLSGITINEIWHKPSAQYPKGMYKVWREGEILYEHDGLPYEHLVRDRMLPFTFIGSIERPDSQYWDAPVKYLRSAQMHLNLYHAQRITIRKKFSNPKWWIPQELELEALPDDSPDQILRGNSNGGMLRPEIIQPAVFPAADDGAMIEQQMMHIVGLHEVSQAQVPGRVEAAKAIEMLKESDADRQQSMLESISSAITNGWYQVLQLGRQYESEDTILQTYTREGLPEIRQWKKDAAKPGQRVVVTMGTGLARSRAARQDQLLNLWQQRIITDPEVMAELMEVPIPTFTAVKMLDLRLARNENLELAKGTAIVPNSWDDHQTHIREHNNYRKTQEYLTADPQTKLKFEHHVQTHKSMLIPQLQEQQQIMALLGPQPQGPQAQAYLGEQTATAQG